MRCDNGVNRCSQQRQNRDDWRWPKKTTRTTIRRSTTGCCTSKGYVVLGQSWLDFMAKFVSKLFHRDLQINPIVGLLKKNFWTEHKAPTNQPTIWQERVFKYCALRSGLRGTAYVFTEAFYGIGENLLNINWRFSSLKNTGFCGNGCMHIGANWSVSE